MITKQPTVTFFECTCPPQKSNRAPYGSLYRYKPSYNELVTYIQVNKNIEDPIWVRLQEFLLDIFSPYVKEQRFIDLCLRKYEVLLKEMHFYSDLEEVMMVR